jgi:uncharacterized protein involved in exopolysaccharide biosynthesis
LEKVKKYFWIFIVVGFISAITGFLFAYFQEVEYESKLTFSLSDDAGSMSSLSSIASEVGITLGSGAGESIFSGDNILEIIKSRRIIEKVLLSLDTINGKVFSLAEIFLNNSGLRNSENNFKYIHFPAGQNRKSFSYSQDSVLQQLYIKISKENLDISRPDRRMSIFQIKVKTTNEQLTKQLTENLLSESKQFYSEIRTRKAKNTLNILESRSEFMREKYDSSLHSSLISTDDNLNPAFAQTLYPTLKSQSNMQIYMEAYSQYFKNLEIARFQYLNQMPVIEIIDDVNLPMNMIKPSKLLYALLFSVVSGILILLFLWLQILYSINLNNK